MAGKKIKTAFEDAAGTFTPKVNQAVDTVKSGISGIVSGAEDAAISIGEVLGTGTSLGQMAASKKNMAQYKSDESYYGGKLEEAEANKPGEYQESEELTNLKGELATVEGQKPDAYVNKYEGQIDALLDKMQAREKFSYDYSTDPTWLSLKDQYQRNAVLGMQGAMGEAAGLTGGYASSYAQQVGQQAYQQNISEMTDIIPELAGQALNVWQAENQQLASNLAALQTQSELDYAQYYNDWQIWNTDRNYMYQKVMDMSDDEFNKYMYGVERWQADRAYYAEQKQIAIQNQQWQIALDEQRREFNNQLAFNYINMGVGAAVDLTTTGMQVGASLAGTAADFALGVGGLAMDKYEIDQNNEYRYAALAQDDRQFNATMDYNYAMSDRDYELAMAEMAQNQGQFNATMDYNYYALEQDDRQFDATMDYNYYNVNSDNAYKYAALAQDDKQHNETLAYNYYNANLDAGIIETQSVDDGPVLDTQSIDDESVEYKNTEVGNIMNEIPTELAVNLTRYSNSSDGAYNNAIVSEIKSASEKGVINETQTKRLMKKYGIKF